MDTPPAVIAASTLVRAEGRDVLALLHRVTTAHLVDLAPGRARAALFCDFRGRLLHRAAVAVTGDGAVWLLRDDAPGDVLLAAVERSVFRDDVRLVDRGAGRRVRAASVDPGLAPGTLREDGGVPVAVRLEDGSGLVVEPGAPLAPDPAAERARIAAGRPRHGHEISEAFTPFEVGLAHEVHLAKGCWTGQEALLRLVTRRSVRRRLVALEGDGPAPAVPAALAPASGGDPVGVLTSAVADGGGGWTGLAVVTHEAAVAGDPVRLPDGRSARTPRPFAPTAPLGLPAG